MNMITDPAAPVAALGLPLDYSGVHHGNYMQAAAELLDSSTSRDLHSEWLADKVTIIMLGAVAEMAAMREETGLSEHDLHVRHGIMLGITKVLTFLRDPTIMTLSVVAARRFQEQVKKQGAIRSTYQEGA